MINVMFVYLSLSLKLSQLTGNSEIVSQFFTNVKTTWNSASTSVKEELTGEQIFNFSFLLQFSFSLFQFFFLKIHPID